MAEGFDTIYNTVFGVLLIAESELKPKNLDKLQAKEAFNELFSLSREVCRRNFCSRRRIRNHHIVGPYFPMVQRMAKHWYKYFVFNKQYILNLFCQASKNFSRLISRGLTVSFCLHQIKFHFLKLIKLIY